MKKIIIIGILAFLTSCQNSEKNETQNVVFDSTLNTHLDTEKAILQFETTISDTLSRPSDNINDSLYEENGC